MPAGAAPPPLDEPALAAAIARCADGDAVAYEAVFDTAAPVVWRLLRAGGADVAQAEALLEVVLWRVWREAARCVPGAAGAWLRGLADEALREAAEPAQRPATRRA